LQLGSLVEEQAVLLYFETTKAPSDDKRWKIVAATMRKLGNQRSALIEALHSAQEAFGYLDKPGLEFIATSLRLPLSQVWGAASFYHHFSMKPPGKHTCVVCTGTACHIKGADRLLASLEKKLGIRSGATTPDGAISVLTARCFGTCGLAPVAVVDGETTGLLTEASLDELLREKVHLP
jgi:bidirectional [NiFe] hydrogenase diaphorase subunit